MEYSPLTVTSGESLIGQYILEDPKTEYKLQLSSLGAQTTIFGGSSMWQTINNVDSFVQSDGTLYINSDYLQTVKSTNKTISNATLITPAIKTISITNPNSTAALKFEVNSTTQEDSYPNLEMVDISGTKMSLTVNGESIKSINLNNSGSS
jgi:hypothetical protein